MLDELRRSMKPTMYSMLMQLPLFQGMSHAHLFEVIEQAIFHFRKVEDGKKVFLQGEQCHQLTFLMSGELVATTQAPYAVFSLEEVITQYAAIEPLSLFGKNPSYKACYTARGEVSLLSIDKHYIYTLLDSYEIFRINFFNLFGSKVENLHQQLWSISPQTLEGRMALFIRSLCTTAKGDKVMNIRMEDLARLMDATRLNVSAVLNKWHSEELIILRRKAFAIPDIEALLDKALY